MIPTLHIQIKALQSHCQTESSGCVAVSADRTHQSRSQQTGRLLSTSLRFIALLLLVVVTSMNSNAQWKSWNWRQVRLDFPFDSGYYLGIHFLASNPKLGWVCGRSAPQNGQSYVLRTTDGGLTWKGAIIPNAPQLESIIFVNEKVGYCSGTQQVDANRGGVYKSNDGGITWTEITPVIRDFAGNPVRAGIWGCNFIDEWNGCVVGGGCANDRQLFFRTNDGGATWKASTADYPNSGLSHVKMLSNTGTCYASSSGLLWRSLDGGYTWQRFSITGPAYWQENLKLVNTSFCVATAGDECSGGGTEIGDIRFSTDLGASWTTRSTGAPMFGTFMLSDSVAWAAGFNRHVMRSSDRGQTWTNYNCGLIEGSHFDDLFFIDDTTGFVVGDGIYRTLKPAEAPPIEVLGDTVFCEGDSVILKGPDGYNQYVWSNGVVAQYLTVRSSGEYWLRVSKPASCPLTTASVKVSVQAKPTSNLSSSRANNHLCYQDSIVLRVQGNFTSILWSTGESSDSIVVRQAGSYTVQLVSPTGCKSTDSIRISGGLKIKPTISSNGVPKFCEGDSLLLIAQEGFSSYTWSTGEQGRAIRVLQAGTYSVMVRDSFGCVWQSDTMTVSVDPNPMFIVGRLGGKMIIDTTNADLMTCDSLVIRNVGVDTLDISKAHLLRNQEFSVPQAQLRLRIPPGEERGLLVCYRPSEIALQRDTMILGDYCRRILFLESVGTANNFNGNTRCNVPIRSTTLQIGTVGLYIFPAYPNPAGSEINIPMIVKNGNESIEIELFDMLGQLREAKVLSTTAAQTPGSSAAYSLDTQLGVQSLEEGHYLLRVRRAAVQETQVIRIRH